MTFQDILSGAKELILGGPKAKQQLEQAQLQQQDLADYNDALGAELAYTKSPQFLAKKAQEWGYQKPESYLMVGGGQAPQVLGVNSLEPTEPPKNNSFSDIAQRASQSGVAAGFHPAIIPSQMAVEGARGTSRFARERNNHFGLGAYDADPTKALRFNSPEESVQYYINMISKDPRYQKAFELRSNPEAYFKALMEAGYASDPNYADTLMNTPEFRLFSDPNR